MNVVRTIIGIQCMLQMCVFGTIPGKNEHPSKQVSLSSAGMDYSARHQNTQNNENDISSDSFKGIYPEGQEVLYSYSAVVTTGTKFPASFVSQFNLTGFIKVQGFENKARVQFQNLKYTMYSGDTLAEKNVKSVKLPDSSATLYDPFDIFYKDGKVSKLGITAGTPLWSKSIKQALGGLLQLDLQNINTDKFSSFKSIEQSIHGNCAVLYSVKPLKNKLHVTKFYSTDDCQRETAEWSNIENLVECINIESQHDKLESFSQKTYRVTPYDDDMLLIREVFSEGKTYKFLKRNSNTTHFTTVSQKLQLISMNDISKITEISNVEEINTLEYNATQFNSFKFSTNEDLNNVVKKVFHLLSAISSELEEKNNLLSEQVNPQESHLIPLLITYMRKLDFNLLEQTYNELKKKTETSSIKVFVNLLPLVGSKDSALFILNLVKDNKITNYDAELLISSLPFHMRQLSEKNLSEFEVLLNLSESTSETVRNAAVLSFATLVHKTCKFSRCKSEITDEYTLHYTVQSFTESNNDYSKQLVYLAGLNNLHSENIVNHLEPIISGEELVPNAIIREFALWAVFPVVAANPDEAYEVYWPVLINRENSLELRATALVLLMEAQHDASVFLQLHQFMTADDTSSHLYNIYYKLINSYSEENEICRLSRTHTARLLLRTLKKPSISQFPSSHYTFSIADGMVKVLSVISPDGISFYITFSSKFTETPVTHYSAYIKLRGIEGAFLNNAIQLIFNSSRPEEMLKSAIQNKLIPENFLVNFILFSQQQVISLRNYDKHNIEGLLKDLMEAFQIENLAKFSLLRASSLFNMETFFVTDIGLPGVLSLDFPTLSSFTNQISTTPAENMDMSFDLRYWSQGTNVLKVKNTIVDIWQGITNTQVTRFNFPVNFKINIKNQLSLQLKPATNKENSYTGLKWHTQTDIFTVTNSENYDALSSSCKECMSLTSVKKNIVHSVVSQFHNDAYSLYSKIFDCEDDGSPNLLKPIQDSNSKNIVYNLGAALSAGFFLEKHLSELPISGSCGYSTVSTTNQEFTICLQTKYENNNITLNIGSSGGVNERCATDNIIISLIKEVSNEALINGKEKYEEKLKEKCRRKLAAGFEEKMKEQFKGKVGTCGAGKSNGYAENVEWCDKEMKPQIMSCLQTEMDEIDEEKIFKFHMKCNKIPKNVEEASDVLIDSYKAAHINNMSKHKRFFVETKHETEATIIIDPARSKYSLNLLLPSKHIVFTDIPLN